MVSLLGWKAWTDIGIVFDSRSSSWDDVPDDGILCRMLYYSDGTRQVQHGMNYYYEAPHDEGTIIGTSSDELAAVEARYPGAVIKRGRWTPDEYYRSVMVTAHATDW